MTPAEQIAGFVREHPGEWWMSAPPDGCAGDDRAAFGRRLHLPSSMVFVYTCNGGVEIAVTYNGGPAQVIPRDLLIGRLAAHEARRFADRGGSLNTLPPWLAEPVRRELRRRAGELLTLAGSSPAHPWFEAVQDARAAIPADDDLTLEQARDVLANLRRVLGMT